MMCENETYYNKVYIILLRKMLSIITNLFQKTNFINLHIYSERFAAIHFDMLKKRAHLVII